MNKRVLVFLVVLHAHVAGVQASLCRADTTVRTVEEYNGIRYTVQLQKDEIGNPAMYHAYVFTPVCEDDLCKPVYIHLYWDLLGNYLRYEVPLDQPLTKMDHVVFTPGDYDKLHSVLQDSESLLKDYQIEELVESTTNARPGGDVDGITGATAKSLQAVVIPGALYTCYTLWHIVHGRVQDTIASVMDSLVSPALLSFFLRSGNYRYQHYALDRLMDGQGDVVQGFEADVVKLIASPNVFLAQRVLKTIAPNYLRSAERQAWLGHLFVGAHYRLQLQMLDKLQGIPLEQGLKSILEAHRQDSNEEIAHKIEQLLNKKT
ncbi:hypothetical protein [Parapedobacter sp. 10938]|uniref:hypothetical protein n=1 Tax=Parapedobacter flavus TaxID=3110225 RepID=UPI002DBD0C49|nr:hypothetical protein [Parapedobacter sp. 10938]MEC3878414.1 hypothetical protein [Parapedobacter sp. 10938]